MQAQILIHKKSKKFIKAFQILMIECAKQNIIVQITANYFIKAIEIIKKINYKFLSQKTLLYLQGVNIESTGMFKGQIRVLNQRRWNFAQGSSDLNSSSSYWILFFQYNRFYFIFFQYDYNNLQITMSMNLSAIFIIMNLLNVIIQAQFSLYNKRCSIHHYRIDHDALKISDLQYQRILIYKQKEASKPIVIRELKLNYTNKQYYFRRFINSGGAGEVYAVQDLQSGQPNIYKRYYVQKQANFRRENYVMNLLGYQVQWMKHCGRRKCDPDTKNYSTIAVYPYNKAFSFRKLEFEKDQTPLIIYKVLQQLSKAHKNGIIHHDIKMGNILLKSLSGYFAFYKTQLIDWNLAANYYFGYQVKAKNQRGTVCFYSPEQLLGALHQTPAVDIWAFAIVIINYITDSKPFKNIDCREDNLQAVIRLVGGQKILELFQKYRIRNIQLIYLLNKIQEYPLQFPPVPLKDMDAKENKQYLIQNTQLLDVLQRMLQPDPQNRATADQLMDMKYFQNIRYLPPKHEYHNKRGNSEQKKNFRQKISMKSKQKTNVLLHLIKSQQRSKVVLEKQYQQQQNERKNFPQINSNLINQIQEQL